jgi:mannosyltransferase OCH1-like enzyme
MSSEEEVCAPLLNHGDDVQKEIPKVIYICHKNLRCLHMTHAFWKKLNPGYEIKLFNDAMCEHFLVNQFSELHQAIFKFIPDGPIKSDFWRLCILYKYGGIYVDADIHPLVSLDKYLMRSCDFVTCITKSNGNFNPHFIATKKNDDVLKKCIDEYIHFYNHHKHSYEYWSWSIVNMFNKFLTIVKNHHSNLPQIQVFSIEQKKYQLFFEIMKHDTSSSNSNKHLINNVMSTLKPHDLHDYYCTFLNKRIFNTRYINYDPNEHTFKTHIVKNRKQHQNIVGFHLNFKFSKLTNMKQIKNFNN